MSLIKIELKNYSNPYNPTTKIKFLVPSVETHRDASLLVKLIVYDFLCNETATLVNEYKPAGHYEMEFNSHSDECQNLLSKHFTEINSVSH